MLLSGERNTRDSSSHSLLVAQNTNALGISDDDDDEYVPEIRESKKSRIVGDDESGGSSSSSSEESSEEEEDEGKPLKEKSQRLANRKSVSSAASEKPESNSEGQAPSQPKSRVDIAREAMINEMKLRTLNEEEKMRVVRETIQTMEIAYQKDLAARENGRPALSKLGVLDEVLVHLNNRDLAEMFVTEGVGRELTNWLKPTKKHLANLRLRTELFRVCELLPFSQNETQLKESKIGKMLYFYAMNTTETDENKRLTNSIVAKWLDQLIGKE